MKRTVCLALLLVLILTGCGGNVSQVEVQEVPSQIYSEAEIDAAVDTAIRYFRQHFSGCTLTQIAYAGDEKAAAMEEWAEQAQAEEAIILVSSFDVDASGGDGSLNPNSTYTGWQWILVRSANGAWEHRDHGYG